MQILNGPPGLGWANGAARNQFTTAQIIALLQAPNLVVDKGLDLLDQNNAWLADVTPNLQNWTVTRNCTATIHGTCNILLSQTIAGGLQRVRPYILLSGAGLSNVRWDMGVYVLNSPVAQLNQNPITWTMPGQDLLCILDTPTGDSYTVAAGVSYLSAIQTIFSSVGMTGSSLLLDGTAEASTVPVALSWALDGYSPGTTGGSYTWLDIINQLLDAINYLPLWADWEGNFRSGPYVPPSALTPEYAFDLTQTQGVQVTDPRTLENDLWQAPNEWIYINENVSAPVEGTGQYTYVNSGSGPSSVAAVGRTITDIEFVNAVDQPTLVAMANQDINQAIQLSQQLAVTVSTMPNQWHFDTITYIDSQLPLIGYPQSVTCQSQGWTVTSDGKDGAATWSVVSPAVVA